MTVGLKRMLQYLAEHELEAVCVSKTESVRYISGFSGSSGILFVTRRQAYLLTDFRYVEQAQIQAPDFEVIRITGNPYAVVFELCKNNRIQEIGFEGDSVTWTVYNAMVTALPQISLKSVRLDTLRFVKTEAEIELIKKAANIADQAFQSVLSYLRPGIREDEVAAEIEYSMRRLGSERPAFDTIVASGVRGALPHGVASAKVLERGELVTLDFGAVYQGYHSDMTRTVAIGAATSRQKDIYRIVLEAQLAGLNAVRSGSDCGVVDQTARDIINQAGFSDCFGHGLGHSVGLAIHEEPRLSSSAAGISLTAGMVVTVEPGIYIPGWGGVRIEDLVVVTSGGREIITASSKDLIEID